MSKHLMAIALLVGAVACGDDGAPVQPDASTPTPDGPPDAPVDLCQPKMLRTDLTWAGTNRADLMAWLASRG
jgi:hypothetical protein